MSSNTASNVNEEPEDVKSILPASFGTLLRAEGIQLTPLWAKDPLSHVGLEYLLYTQHGFKRLRWRLAHIKHPETCATTYARYIRDKKEFFLIPGPLECDCLFLRDRADAAYVEAAARYLRGVTSVMSILAAGVWKYPTVGSLEPCEWSRNSAVGAAEASAWYGREMSPMDWVTFCRNFNQGRFSDPGKGGAMLFPHVMFPKLPAKLCDHSPSPHIPVQATRIGYYFGMTVSSKNDPVLQELYEEAYMFEYSVNYITGFMKEMERGRIWDVRTEYETFLEDSIPPFPSIPMEKERIIKIYLGYFENVIQHTDPWRTFEKVVRDITTLFSQGDRVFTARKLFKGFNGSFTDARSLNSPVQLAASASPNSSQHYNDVQSAVESSSDSLIGSPRLAPLRVYSRKRPRVGTTAHRMELESRRRTKPPRKCSKSK